MNSGTSLSKPDHQRRPEKPNQEDDEHSEVQSATKLDELNFAIRKLQMWEFALHRRFGDRFKDNPQQLAAHPIWQKVFLKIAIIIFGHLRFYGRFSVRCFGYFNHLSNRILKQIIYH